MFDDNVIVICGHNVVGTSAQSAKYIISCGLAGPEITKLSFDYFLTITLPMRSWNTVLVAVPLSQYQCTHTHTHTHTLSLSPCLTRFGDLGEFSRAGSLHEYLVHIHDNGRCPVTSFWWGKEHVVSVCSPQAFKDTVKLTEKAGE